MKKLQDKKILILIIVSIAAFFSLLYGILTPSKIKRQIMSRTSAVSREGQRPVTPIQSALMEDRGTARSEYQSWGRDPFSPSAINRAVDMELNGILWDTEAPQAIINEDIVGIGDRVRGNIIVDITQDTVILNDGLTDFELTLK